MNRLLIVIGMLKKIIFDYKYNPGDKVTCLGRKAIIMAQRIHEGKPVYWIYEPIGVVVRGQAMPDDSFHYASEEDLEPAEFTIGPKKKAFIDVEIERLSLL